MSKWFVGIGCKPREYTVNSVRYIVSSRFTENDNTVADRLKSYIKSNFADLTAPKNRDIMTDEYACSAAGEED